MILLLRYLCIRSFQKLRAFAIGLLCLLCARVDGFPVRHFYALSVTSCGIGVSLGSPLPLPTPSHPAGSFRVRHRGLKRNAVGGVFLDAPSALCGFQHEHGVGQVYRVPIVIRHALITLGHTPYTAMVSDLLADTLGKVCLGGASSP